MRRGRYGEHPLLPYLFVLPHLIFFMIFIGFATVLGFWISLHKFDFLQPVHPFIGLRNYVHLLLTPGDLYHDYFFAALGNTLIFVLMTVPALVIELDPRLKPTSARYLDEARAQALPTI